MISKPHLSCRGIAALIVLLVISWLLGACNWWFLEPSPIALASATPRSGDAPLTVTLDGSRSSGPFIPITKYEWDFGDGTSAEGPTLTHTYTQPGFYVATLEVFTGKGGHDNDSVSIAVGGSAANVPPVASFTATPSSGTAPLEVSFDASASTDSDGSIVSYVWDFGDTDMASGETITHTYGTTGTYRPILTVIDNSGATDTTSLQIEATAPPTPKDLWVDANDGSDTTGDGSAGNPYKTITKALQEAESQNWLATIYIAPGIYNAFLGEVFPMQVRDANLIGQGATPDDVQIIGWIEAYGDLAFSNFSSGPEITIHSGPEDSVTLQDLKVEWNVDVSGSYSSPAGTVLIQNVSADKIIVTNGADILIEDSDCNRLDVRGENATVRRCSAGAIWELGITDDAVIEDCTIGSVYGIKGGQVVVTACTITGVVDVRQGTVTITGNTFVGGSITVGHTVGETVFALISDNEISNATTGITVLGSASVKLNGNDVTLCGSYGVRISSDSPDIDLGGGSFASAGGNIIRDNGYNIRDERPAHTGYPIYAKGNTWDDPQPTGTVAGPTDNSPNHVIDNTGNSIIFSE